MCHSTAETIFQGLSTMDICARFQYALEQGLFRDSHFCAFWNVPSSWCFENPFPYWQASKKNVEGFFLLVFEMQPSKKKNLH
jgi:hypothetical protein